MRECIEVIRSEGRQPLFKDVLIHDDDLTDDLIRIIRPLSSISCADFNSCSLEASEEPTRQNYRSR